MRSLFLNGQSGVVADIVDANGQLCIRQEPTDSQLLRCASLFRLEPNETTGRGEVVAAHERADLEGEVLVALPEELDALLLHQPLRASAVVDACTAHQPVHAGRIDSVSLLRLERPSDRK